MTSKFLLLHTFMSVFMLSCYCDVTVYSDLSGLYRSHTGNLQYWSWTSLNSDVDTGEVLSVTFDKRYTDTALRLTANGAHLSAQKSGFGYCAKW